MYDDKPYPGLVLKVDTDDVLVRCMHRVGQNWSYDRQDRMIERSEGEIVKYERCSIIPVAGSMVVGTKPNLPQYIASLRNKLCKCCEGCDNAGRQSMVAEDTLGPEWQMVQARRMTAVTNNVAPQEGGCHWQGEKPTHQSSQAIRKCLCGSAGPEQEQSDNQAIPRVDT